MLVVSILIFLGSIYQFNDAFRSWANNYLGDYLSCLLETGELPAIGGTGGSASSCEAIFKPFNLADGRPLDSKMGGGGTGNTGGGGGSSGDGGGPGKDDGRGGNSRSGGVGESSSSPGYSRVNRSGVGADGSRNGSDPDADDSNGGRSGRNKRKASYTGSTEAGVPGNVSSSSRRISRQRSKGLEGTYYVARERRADEQPVRTLAKVSESSEMPRNAKVLIKRKPAATSVEEEDKPMTFGDYLRYILIAAIIIVLLIVLGGQFTQISKEME